MNNTKTRDYQVAVAIAFGLIGFGVNFLDIEFMEGATFKISILAGLFFPLVVTLAWGWRYGLLSALAGGCQTMWWLWSGDGWGVVYAVPVFTLWIVWHGWWAERRVEGHPWYISAFAVEVPFRIVIELGFLVVFRWLVSLNPPPWNPAVSWNQVSGAWLQTVAIKHVVTAYILLTAAYVALSLGVVRRFFGLPPRPAQRDTTAIYAGAALFGLLLWTLDALLHYLVFPREGQTFWGIAVYGADAHEVFMRSLYLAVAMLAGVVLARVNRRRVALQELLDHRNLVLAAIRNVNQLIVREKNPLRLMDEACRLLVKNQGYHNAWMVLMADGHPGEPFFNAGFNGDFAPMAERLRAGDLPACAKAALAANGVQVEEDPPTRCVGCPLAFAYGGRAGLCLRLEHAGRVFGWMSISCHAGFARSAEEHDLLTKVAGDIAFALWAIEAETQREAIAAKYAAVMASTSDAVVAGDLDGRITVFNPGAEKLFGCSADEVLGSHITRFCPEDRLEEQAEMMRRVRDTGAIPGYETERLTADGQRVPVEITLSLNTDAQGRPRGTNGIFRDITERKKAEETLRSNYTLLRIAGETARFGGWSVDLKKNICTWSDAVADIHEVPHGYAPPVEEGINFYAPEWHDKITEVFTACAQKGVSYDEEMEIITKKGNRVWVRTSGHAVKDENGRIIKVQGSFQDISEHKRTEENLKEKTQLLKAVSDNMFDLVALTDLEGNFMFVGASHSILGYDIDSLTGRNVMEFVHPEDVREVAASFHDFLSTEDDNRKVEYRYRCADGSYRWFETVGRFVRDDNGDLKGIVFSTRDVTERRQMEQELKESEERFRALHNASFGGIAVHDKGLILECNQGLSEITGYAYDELIGMEGLSLISDGTRDEVVRHINAGYEKPYEAEGVRKDGGIYSLRLEARNIRYKGKDVRVVEFRDISENKRAEKEKEHLEAQLIHAQKMESVGRLAGGVAHDFNNMLNVILGYTELALQSMDKDDPLYSDLTEILDAARRSSDITRQLLAFARKQTIAPVALDLNETVEGMLKMLRRLIGEDIDLSWEPGSGLWPVNMDPAQVDQVLANLLVNARDAISGVGKVTIETDNTVLDETYCADRPDFVPGEFVVLAVSDNGCGMDKTTMNNLFEPFFTTKSVGEGTGLGLATVYGIVRQNNGFINVYSEPDQGTTFKIYLPRHAGEAATEPLFTGPETLSGNGETVLVVEDEAAILKLARKMLTGLGYNVLTEPTPSAALKRAGEHRDDIDLLVTDVIMPEMNGRDLAERLHVFYPGLKVLYMSGYTADVIARRGILDQGVQFIQKPFNKRDLARKVREALTE